MKVFLAATQSQKYVFEHAKPKYILESFYYIKDWQIAKINEWNMFFLDSGAFTFMNSQKDKKVDFEIYLDKYINFINKHNIKYFFELDLDTIIGFENVKKLTLKLEKGTNKQCIPVWHKNRGLKEFIKLTKEYNYIAIGGLVTKEIKRSEFPYLKNLIAISHKNNCKIHGLGFTNTNILKEYHFDSVDSASWLLASNYGNIPYFHNGYIRTFSKPKNKRMIEPKDVKIFAFKEWIKFQEYAERNL